MAPSTQQKPPAKESSVDPEKSGEDKEQRKVPAFLLEFATMKQLKGYSNFEIFLTFTSINILKGNIDDSMLRKYPPEIVEVHLPPSFFNGEEPIFVSLAFGPHSCAVVVNATVGAGQVVALRLQLPCSFQKC